MESFLVAILNWTGQSLGAESSLTYAATLLHPQITIPLYISDYPMPSRAQKLQEINTPEHHSVGYSTGMHAGFFAAQEQLQTQITGFLITPMSATAWTPTTTGKDDGTSLGLTGINNAELILAYMEGRMDSENGGFGDIRTRREPSQFMDPYGNIYTDVYVMLFEAAFTVTARKQTFSMTLRLGV
jgi:hypothetical protein